MVGGPVDEPDAEVLLQGGEGAGDRGLGEAEAGGGAGDVALVGDGEEGAQMADLDTAAGTPARMALGAAVTAASKAHAREA